MKSAERKLADARMEERIARARWFDTLDELQERATPGGIADEVWEGIVIGAGHAANKAVNAVRERPATATLAGSTLALFFLRRPIARFVGRLFRHEETGADAGR